MSRNARSSRERAAPTVMASFAVPKIYQQKVLMIGIVIALVLRGIFIAVVPR